MPDCVCEGAGATGAGAPPLWLDVGEPDDVFMGAPTEGVPAGDAAGDGVTVEFEDPLLELSLVPSLEVVPSPPPRVGGDVELIALPRGESIGV